MKTTLEIQNLKCGGCAHTIISKLNSLPGLCDVEVNNDTYSVTFTHITKHNIHEAEILLAKLGYPVIGKKNALTTKAKSFVSCAIGRINS
jgi:copper chaperone CopZ